MTLSHLYVVASASGLVKIGHSAKPKKRIVQIEMSIGTSVVNQYISPLCLNARQIERHLHQHFAKQRQQGEWFTVTFSAVIKEVKQQKFHTDEPNRIMPFEFGDYQLRTFVDNTGEPWFCLKDTCEILNVGNPSEVVKRLQKSRVVSIEVAFKRSVARLNFVNEANFYRVIFQSRKKEATMFQDWVFEEVLPSIRKTGQYSVPSRQLEKKMGQADFEAFIKDCFIPEPTNMIRSRDIYLVYQSWCLQNDCPTRTIQWVGTQLGKLGYRRSKCPPNGVACWCGFRLNNPACPTDSTIPKTHQLLSDLQNHLSAVSKMLEEETQYSNAELLSMVRTAHAFMKSVYSTNPLYSHSL